MTLHWWMHWFWVTAQLAAILASPLPSTTEAPKENLFPANATQNLTIEAPGSTLVPRGSIDGSGVNVKPEKQEQPEISTRASFRVAKAIGSYDSPSRANVASAIHLPGGEEAQHQQQRVSGAPLIGESEQQRIFSSTARPVTSDRDWSGNVVRSRTSPGKMIITRREGPNVTGDVIPAVKRDSRITWVLTTSRPTPVRRRTEEEETTFTEEDIIRNYSSVGQEQEKDLTVLPLRVEATRFKLVVNRTRTITASGADGFSTRTFNGSEDIEIDQEQLAEPRLAATAASILQGGISDSTRLSRAQNAFTRDFQRDQEEDRSSEIDVSDVILEGESRNAEIESSTPSAVDIAAITGSCLATVVLLSTMASLGFVMYRRKYLNPPQTLNSDKCSNPDSSGYIDDSTIRDNSEEMYSLDNDSFLNSLEAMTIQNYWTDSVKHTKL